MKGSQAEELLICVFAAYQVLDSDDDVLLLLIATPTDYPFPLAVVHGGGKPTEWIAHLTPCPLSPSLTQIIPLSVSCINYLA